MAQLNLLTLYIDDKHHVVLRMAVQLSLSAGRLWESDRWLICLAVSGFITPAATDHLDKCHGKDDYVCFA